MLSRKPLPYSKGMTRFIITMRALDTIQAPAVFSNVMMDK